MPQTPLNENLKDLQEALRRRTLKEHVEEIKRLERLQDLGGVPRGERKIVKHLNEDLKQRMLLESK